MHIFRTSLSCLLASAPFALTLPFTNTTSEDTSCANGPGARSCWGNGYGIDTDWYHSYPDTGKTVYYDLIVSSFIMNVDGVYKQMMVFNGQFPGPTIVADWGDTIQVTVRNNLTFNGTSIHWHGMRQANTNQMDGTNGLTECPLAPGQSKTYVFKATQYGTSWYHSHYSTQYVDGLVGAIQINGPATADYDIDLGPLPVTDFFHQPVFSIVASKLTGPPTAQNILVNGSGVYNGAGEYARTILQPGKKHRLRLINTGVNNYIHVSLDGHPFTVIAADFVPVTPYTTQSLVIAVGQRYDVIIDADQAVANYWFRVKTGGGQCDGPNEKTDTQGAIFSYVGAPAASPWSTSYALGSGCTEETSLIPYLQVNPTAPAQPPTLLDITVDLTQGPSWKVNGNPMVIDWTTPTLSYIVNGTYNFPASDNAIVISGTNTWVYWLVQNDTPLPHPVHLHGHDFVLVAQGQGSGAGAALSLQNPLRRDTHTVESGGYIVIGFLTDNPGAWLFHCHIPFHISNGLGVQFVEQPTKITSALGYLGELNIQCKAWDQYLRTAPAFEQGDSGL